MSRIFRDTIKEELRKKYTDINGYHLRYLLDIWLKLLDEIILITSNKTHELEVIHVDFKMELVEELMYIMQFVFKSVLLPLALEHHPNSLNVAKERCKLLYSKEAKEKIINTGNMFFEEVIRNKYNQRWKPKSEKKLNKKVKNKKRIIKNTNKNHFITESFIRRFWSDNNDDVFICQKFTNSKEKKKFSKWGYEFNIYSNELEDFFSLTEGDALSGNGPISRLVEHSRLTQREKEYLIAFILMHFLRNPHYREKIINSSKKFICEFFQSYNEQLGSTCYETIFKSKKLYNHFALPLNNNQWFLVVSNNENFILPDTVMYFSPVKDSHFLIMPISLNHCLVVSFRTKQSYKNKHSLIIRKNNPTKRLISLINNTLMDITHKQYLSSATFKFKRAKNSVIDNIQEIENILGKHAKKILDVK